MWLIQYRFNLWRRRNPELFWKISTAFIGLSVGVAIFLGYLCVNYFWPSYPLR